MVEIFTQAVGQGGDLVRSVGKDVTLAKPSDVYFGQHVAGIAYYEKSGADLRITLLDSQEILVRDFFVIGNGGEFSRLLNGAGGTVEVTGLIAPEPFVAREEAPAPVVHAVEAVSGETALPASVQPEGARETVSITVDTSGGEPAAAGSGGGFGFAGIGGDQLLYGAVGLPVAYSISRNDEAEPEAGMDPEIAAFLSAIDAAGGEDLAGLDGGEDGLDAALDDTPAEGDAAVFADAPGDAAIMGAALVPADIVLDDLAILSQTV